MKFFAVLSLAAAMGLSLSAQSPAPARPGSAAPSGKVPVLPGSPAPVSPAITAPDPTPPDKVVMTVGAEKITAKEFDMLIDALPEQYRAQARGPMKRQMAEQIARVKMLAGEARRSGMDKDPAVLARIHFQTENLLAGAAYNDLLLKSSVDDAMLRKYYADHAREYETVQARHILIRFKGSPVPLKEGKQELTEEQALARIQEIRKQLVAGGDFAALAKAESDDTGSGANGGDLGSFGHGQMVPAFDETAFKLAPGQLSEPIKTQFGYHVIRVDKHENKSFDSVRNDLEQKLRPEAARVKVESLIKTANVVLDDSYFGPAPAVPAPPAGAPGVSGAAPPAATTPGVTK